MPHQSALLIEAADAMAAAMKGSDGRTVPSAAISSVLILRFCTGHDTKIVGRD